MLYCREYGIAYNAPDAPLVVLKALSAEYHAPLFLHQDYVVTARCVAFRNTSFTKHYAVWAEGRMVAEGTAVIVLTEADSVTKCRIPDPVRDAFDSRDRARQD